MSEKLSNQIPQIQDEVNLNPSTKTSIFAAYFVAKLAELNQTLPKELLETCEGVKRKAAIAFFVEQLKTKNKLLSKKTIWDIHLLCLKARIKNKQAEKESIENQDEIG